MTTDTQTTQAVVAHHLESALALASKGTDGIAELMKDYADSARIFTLQGVIEDEAGRRAFFESMVPLMKDLGPSIKIDLQEARDDIFYLVWSAGAAVPQATDTFVVRDGKIVAQTFTAYMPG